MMNTLSKKLILAAVVLPLTFSTAYAKSGHHNQNNMRLQGMLKQVDLTAAQQTKVDKIILSYRTSQKQKQSTAMLSILKADKFSAKSAGELIESNRKMRNKNQVTKMKMMFDVYHALNAKQQAKMDLLIEMNQQKMHKKGHGKYKGQGYNS